MRILLTGATGFIGRRLRAALLDEGHTVVGIARRPPASDRPQLRWLALDLQHAVDPAHWRPHVADVDVVVYAAGVFAANDAAALEAIHARAPQALFNACREAGVARVVQVSALGAAADAPTAFLRTKHAADAALLALPLDAVVVRPSLVFGPDGASSRLFLALASLPLLVLPDGGRQRVQPVHVDDLVRALVRLATGAAAARGVLDAVGPFALPLADYLQDLRTGLGLPHARVLSLPMRAARPLARAARALPFASPLVTEDSLRMLEAGNPADARPFADALGRPSRAPAAFVAPQWRELLRMRALLAWLLPVLRVSIAVVWIATGIVSLGVYPVPDSYALLARAGVPAAMRPVVLYGAALLDLALGVLTLVAPRRWLWRAQGALMLLYMAVIAVRLPEWWIHPYGPIIKNLPMLAALWLLDALHPRRDR